MSEELVLQTNCSEATFRIGLGSEKLTNKDYESLTKLIEDIYKREYPNEKNLTFLNFWREEPVFGFNTIRYADKEFAYHNSHILEEAVDTYNKINKKNLLYERVCDD